MGVETQGMFCRLSARQSVEAHIDVRDQTRFHRACRLELNTCMGGPYEVGASLVFARTFLQDETAESAFYATPAASSYCTDVSPL